MNERMSFSLNKKSVATGCNEGFVEDIFPRDGMEKTASSRKDI